MSDGIIDILNPTGISTDKSAKLAHRLHGLKGTTLGMLSNVWVSYDLLLSVFADIAKSTHDVAEVLRISNPNLSRGTPAGTLEDLAQKADGVIVGLGNCGSCATASINDALLIESKGVPTVVIITEPFRLLSEKVARSSGATDLPMIVLPSNIEELPKNAITLLARATFPHIATSLTGN